jgi:hypothetical protein
MPSANSSSNFTHVFYWIYWIQQANDTYDQLPGTLTKPGKPDGDRKYHLKKMLNIIWKWVTRPRTDQQRQATTGMTFSCPPREQATPGHVAAKAALNSSEGLPGWSIVISCLHVGQLSQEDVKYH